MTNHVCKTCGAPATACIGDDWYCHEGADPTHYMLASWDDPYVAFLRTLGMPIDDFIDEMWKDPEFVRSFRQAWRERDEPPS